MLSAAREHEAEGGAGRATERDEPGIGNSVVPRQVDRLGSKSRLQRVRDGLPVCIQHENRARRETYEMRQPRVSDTAASELDLRELRAPVQRHCYANWPEWISFWPTGKRPKGLWTVLSVPIRSRRAAEPGAAGGSSGTPTARRTYRDQRGRSGRGRSGPQESPSRIRGERGSTRPKVIA